MLLLGAVIYTILSGVDQKNNLKKTNSIFKIPSSISYWLISSYLISVVLAQGQISGSPSGEKNQFCD